MKPCNILGVITIGCVTLGVLDAQTPDSLTQQETAAGWRLLFDGS